MYKLLMIKALLIVVFVLPLCALVVMFCVQAERMMREEREQEEQKPRKMHTGGLSRAELIAATRDAMRTDARLARMRAGYRRSK